MGVISPHYVVRNSAMTKVYLVKIEVTAVTHGQRN